MTYTDRERADAKDFGFAFILRGETAPAEWCADIDRLAKSFDSTARHFAREEHIARELAERYRRVARAVRRESKRQGAES